MSKRLGLLLSIAVIITAPSSVHANSDDSPSEEADNEPSITFEILTDVTYYDPSICDVSPINCFGDPNWTAGGFFVPDWYDELIACPSPLPMGQLVTISGLGTYMCGDRGGSIKITEDGVWRFDVLHHVEDEPILRTIRSATVTLSASAIQRVLEEHSTPFVEKDLSFSCPANSCDNLFWRFGQYIANPSHVHGGTDVYTGDTGVGPVYAAAAGIVTESDYVNILADQCGGVIRINHQNASETRYCHLTQRLVVTGDYVAERQLIGYAGFSGYTLEGQHVHIELRINGIKLNFEHYLNTGAPFYYLNEQDIHSRLQSAGIYASVEVEEPVLTYEVSEELTEEISELPEIEVIEEKVLEAIQPVEVVTVTIEEKPIEDVSVTVQETVVGPSLEETIEILFVEDKEIITS